MARKTAPKPPTQPDTRPKPADLIPNLAELLDTAKVFTEQAKLLYDTHSATVAYGNRLAIRALCADLFVRQHDLGCEQDAFTDKVSAVVKNGVMFFHHQIMDSRKNPAVEFAPAFLRGDEVVQYLRFRLAEATMRQELARSAKPAGLDR